MTVEKFYQADFKSKLFMKDTKTISQNRFDLFRMGKQNNFDSSKISSIECKAGLRNLDRIILNRRPSSGFKMTVHFHVFFHLKKGAVRAKRMVIISSQSFSP